VVVAAVVAALVPVAGCSEPVQGRGTLVPGSQVTPELPSPSGTGRASGPPAPTPTPTPSKRRDPAAVARAVDIRASDLPAGWRQIPDSPGGQDSLSWLIVCLRDAGIGPGTMSGAATPDFSSSGTTRASQVGSATGLFPDDAAARRYVAGLRDPSVGKCMAAEALRTWPDSFSSGPSAFAPQRVNLPPADEGSAMVATARNSSQRLTIQFIAIRTGPIVTMLDTIWIGSPNASILATAGTRIATRQHSA